MSLYLPSAGTQRIVSFYPCNLSFMGKILSSSFVELYLTLLPSTGQSWGEDMSNTANVRVIVRIRPLSQGEFDSQAGACVTATSRTELCVVYGSASPKIYAFDQVFYRQIFCIFSFLNSCKKSIKSQ